MKTLMELAKSGEITEIMQIAAKNEGVTAETIRQGLANGSIIVPFNINSRNRRNIMAIGSGIKTKVNVNIGASQMLSDINLEREKLKLAEEHKADAIMDLSVGEKANEVRDMVLAESKICVGTVPIYQALNRLKHQGVEALKIEDFFAVITDQAEKGVDFITVHCGVTKEIVEYSQKNPRLAGIVSRGGAIMAEWILKNNQENPLFKHYDRLLDLVKQYDITLSLGDGFRPGAIHDATDWCQIAELKVLGDLTKRAWEKNVQIMVEGPGHVPLNQIKENMELEKKYCHGAPFYILGPLVTDIAPGYDHITSAIGAAIAATHGADFLCYVTPAEHLHLPDDKDLVDGLIAHRIAGHAADIAQGLKGAKELDFEISTARKNFDWDQQVALSINPKEARRRLDLNKIDDESGVCSMCGDFCSMKRMNDL
ncbi:MAG: phosphomethylpyrimidine synthase ThiC [bacterium]|nr:phosphomethylpyrimidine synthase ThiC [bacterium]